MLRAMHTLGDATVINFRGPHPETVHQVAVAVSRPDGSLVAFAGDPRERLPLRSTAKPFQALTLFTSGAHARFGVTTEELALACASHQGAPRHVALAAGLLDRLGLSVDALACGAHAPMDPASRDALVRDGRPTALHNNCSGKHAAMLASALALGAPTKGYLDPDHPLQRRIHDIVAELSGVARVAHATDGCSAPTWILGLDRLARMFATLAAPKTAPAPLRDGLAACFDAMSAHPGLVAGEGVADTVLMRALPGRLVAKRGAAGCYAMALRGTDHGPLGIAVKVLDGSGDARTPAVVAVLAALDALDPAATGALGPLARPRCVNWRGTLVGHWEARVTLTWT